MPAIVPTICPISLERSPNLATILADPHNFIFNIHHLADRRMNSLAAVLGGRCRLFGNTGGNIRFLSNLPNGL